MPDSQQARRWYRELDLKAHCEDNELHNAYRSLALKWHPDRHADGGELITQRFQLITSA